MSVFTVVIIIWAIYQLIITVLKKSGTPQTLGKRSDSLNLPDGRFLRNLIQATSRGTWREQLKQALENGPYPAESLRSTRPTDAEEPKNYDVETEGNQGIERTQGVVETQGTEETSEYVGILGAEAYKSTVEIPAVESAINPSGLSDVSRSLTERELVQGVIWAEILGKPRAVHPFRGSRG